MHFFVSRDGPVQGYMCVVSRMRACVGAALPARYIGGECILPLIAIATIANRSTKNHPWQVCMGYKKYILTES